MLAAVGRAFRLACTAGFAFVVLANVLGVGALYVMKVTRALRTVEWSEWVSPGDGASVRAYASWYAVATLFIATATAASAGACALRAGRIARRLALAILRRL